MIPQSVMLVEDNLDDQFLARRTLGKFGVRTITVAGDGEEAVELLMDSARPLPEVLILDLRLPKKHGLTVLAELRRHNRTMSLPILVVTSSDDPKDREDCLRLGALAFLSKPLELTDLQKALGGL